MDKKNKVKLVPVESKPVKQKRRTGKTVTVATTIRSEKQ